MSGILKAIGKAFKSVVRVVKKIALPVLAIGAVILTGGAALGILPSVGSLAGTLGLSPALTGILTTAARGATMGAIGSAVTGGNIVKGATTGFAVGGALGAAGQALNPAVRTASQVGNITGEAGHTAAQGIGSGLANGGGQTLEQSFDATFGGTGGGAAAAAGATNAGLASLPASVPVAAGTTSSSGLFGFLNNNPMVAAGLIQGIGAGISANATAKEARRQDEQTRANYAGYTGIGNLPTGMDVNPALGTYLARDPVSGRIIQKVG